RTVRGILGLIAAADLALARAPRGESTAATHTNRDRRELSCWGGHLQALARTPAAGKVALRQTRHRARRSEEHSSELKSRENQLRRYFYPTRSSSVLRTVRGILDLIAADDHALARTPNV